MPRFPTVARLAPLVLIGVTLQLCAQNTTSLTRPAKAAADLGPTPPIAPVSKAEPDMTEIKLMALFDKNGDHQLDATERQAALAYLAQHPLIAAPVRPGRPVPVQPVVAGLEPTKRGQALTPGTGENIPSEDLFDPKILRTLFLNFADADWEHELAEFARTDVQVPARLEVDGTILNDVGVRFRPPGIGEVFPSGYKRTLLLKLDFTATGQQLSGHHQLQLLASADDPTLLRTVLFHQVAREYIAAPADAMVRVVINGEDWGVYTNMEPFDELFVRKKINKVAGAFWTAGPGANLDYLGDDPEAYRSRYQLESTENPAAWARLIELCKFLHQPTDDDTGHALAAIIDVDSTLRYFALQNALINQDGYGGTTGGYGLFLAGDGRFRLIPLEAEHSFRLLQVTEYDQPAPRRGRKQPPGQAENREGRPGDQPGDDDEREAALLRPYLHKEFPKQSGTNLAVLLSYSLIAKADSDQDEKVTAEEWHDFANSWYIVMDEDQAGRLTREQFIRKVRLLVTPPSVIDGRTTQTFGQEDAAAEIGGDFLRVIDVDHDGYVTREKMTAAFDRLFVEWTGRKSSPLTQPVLQKGLSAFFSKSIFMADQTFIPTAKTKSGGLEDSHQNEREGRGGGRKRGGQGDGGGGSGANIGPFHLGLPRRGDDSDSSRTVVTYGEQLDALDGAKDATKPLLAKLLSLPHWRTRYSNYLSQFTDDSLLWSKLGPVAKQYHDLIAAEVRQETHKPFSYERFVQELDQDPAQGSGRQDERQSLKSFLMIRRSYLMKKGADFGSN